jgi:HEAT repeat protein
MPQGAMHPAVPRAQKGRSAQLSLETLIPQLQDQGQPVPTAELTSLSALDRPGMETFLEVWRSLSVQRRRDIIDRLIDLAEDNVELDFNNVYLVGLLDDDVQVRAESVKGLWEYEGDDLVVLLMKMLRDPEAIVRGEVALGLGRFLLRAELDGDANGRIAEVEETLRGVLEDETELAEVRGRALEALGVRSHPWVRDMIDDAYGSGERRLRISAIHAMGRNANLEWLPIIQQEMESEDAEMRFEAATAAGALADEEAVPDLARLAEDEDAEVQEAAISALGQIGGSGVKSVLHAIAAEHKDERVLDAVSDALSEAEFIDDPLGFRMRLGRDALTDGEEDDE